MSRKPTQNIDYTNRDYEAYREMLIQELQRKMPEYTDTSQTDAGIVILECLANGLDILSLYADVLANDLLLPTTQDRRIACIIAQCLGYSPYNQTASITPQVFVLNNIKDKDTIIEKGTVVTTKAESGQVAISFETMEKLTIPKGCLGNEKDENGNYLYTVNIQQGTTIKDDLLGSSTEAIYQEFQLHFSNVLVDSIELYVNEGDGKQLWKQVDSFLDENLDGVSRVYTAVIDDFNRCFIRFGDNVRGKIPRAFDNGISATYRVGGGEQGNVQAYTITELGSNIASIDSTFNPVSSTVLGHEKETLEEIRENAPASLRTKNRAVTLQDYSDLLKINNKGNLYAIYKSKALRDENVGIKANIYYQLRQGYEMTEALEAEIREFFKSRIMVGTSLDIYPHTSKVVDLNVNLIVDRDYSKEELERNITEYIQKVFFNFGEFSFDDEFVKSDLESEIKKTFSGVRSFRIVSPDDDIIGPTLETDILELGNITFNTTGGRENEPIIG